MSENVSGPKGRKPNCSDAYGPLGLYVCESSPRPDGRGYMLLALRA